MSRKQSRLPPAHMVDAIELCARRALEHEQSEKWSQWYWAAREFCGRLSAQTGLTLDTVVGVVSAMSPQVGWDSQVEWTPVFLWDAANGKAPEDCRGPSYVINKRKAFRILAGVDPLSVLKGPKVRAFYSTILAGESRSGPVVVDRWAVRIAYTGHDEPVTLTARRYETVANAYREVGVRLGMPASEVQALTWSARREGAA